MFKDVFVEFLFFKRFMYKRVSIARNFEYKYKSCQYCCILFDVY